MAVAALVFYCYGWRLLAFDCCIYIGVTCRLAAPCCEVICYDLTVVPNLSMLDTPLNDWLKLDSASGSG